MNGIFLDLLEANVSKVGVWDVSDEDPPDLEHPFPFVGCPYGAASSVINLNGKGIMRRLCDVGLYETHRR